MIDGLLPRVRELLASKAKEFPHARGGAPKKLSSAEDQEKIRAEIKALREPGVKLMDVFKRVAQRHEVSPSKIKQIWYRSPR